jgi:hypothetical protein
LYRRIPLEFYDLCDVLARGIMSLMEPPPCYSHTYK